MRPWVPELLRGAENLGRRSWEKEKTNYTINLELLLSSLTLFNFNFFLSEGTNLGRFEGNLVEMVNY